ncbi:MAG: LysR family transcriptional regulator [Halomonas sp.]|nr:LysR family transcriptional regulator [Halomonas sp.]MDN6296886.1 LysR family transcriptional regulator [Halomonas sp.]MDN6314396.1 LysR family transcriptional regulator [Halomonas sp.]MDN6335644.1 LysR family transcriptional regulator [Halomonas sp.]
MEIELARTFLEILRQGSFSAAAETLHVTQTTVTARMHKLERHLECRLLQRSRGGITMTSDGERFADHAAQLVQIWETLQRELPLPQGIERVVAIGGEASLWHPLLSRWMSALRQRLPTLAVRIRVGERRELQQQLSEGGLDAVLVHQADYWPGMQVSLMQEEKLVMVQTPGAGAADPYVYVDWGEVFRREHDAVLPQLASPVMMLNLGPLALEYLLANAGSGYFRLSAVRAYLDSGRLERVPGMPEFAYPVYLVHPRERLSPHLREALALLNEIS